MATYSSGESSKPYSPHKAFILSELKEAKRSLAQKDEAMKKLEERLQRLEMNCTVRSSGVDQSQHDGTPKGDPWKA